jgi:hypothetical protein
MLKDLRQLPYSINSKFARGLFPLWIERRKPFLNFHQFAIDLLGATGLLVSFRLLHFGSKFDLPRFEPLNFLFQLMNALLLGLAPA